MRSWEIRIAHLSSEEYKQRVNVCLILFVIDRCSLKFSFVILIKFITYVPLVDALN